MEQRQLEIIKAKQLRGDILRLLYEASDSDVALGTIKNLLRYKSYYGDRDVLKAIEYLSNTGDTSEENPAYITVKKEGKANTSLLKITRAGIKLFEGDFPDSGVIFNE